MTTRCLPILALLLLQFAACAEAEERIERFDATISIDREAYMTVTERIEVTAEGNRIRRGIFRDLPLSYRDRAGQRFRVGFELVSVRRDGIEEPVQVQELDNGIRIRIGSADRLIEPGRHVYEITYRTWRQLGFFEAYDELYWNVTGTGWEFRILAATARVTLPGEVAADDLRLAAWTGAQGSTAQNVTWRRETGSTVSFATTVPLDRRAGLTIAVGFPKGLVRKPSLLRHVAWFAADNPQVPVGIAGLLAVLGWFAYWWRRVGRDPDRGVIIPRYEPPEGLSPAGVRYLVRKGYDQTGFVAAVVHLSVLGLVEIEEEDDRWTLRRTGAGMRGSRGEKRIVEELFKRDRVLVLESSNHERIRQALFWHERALVHELEGMYLLRNRDRWLPGLLLSIVAIVAMHIAAGGLAGVGVLLMLIPLLVLPLGIGIVVLGLSRARGPGSGAVKLASSIILLLFAGPGLLAATNLLGLWGAVVALLIGLANVAFFYWLEAPTLEGRELLDGIDGFRLYIEVAEKDDLVRAQEPPRTLERFERFLPYAIALDVAEAWAGHFHDVLTRALTDGSLAARGWATASVTRGRLDTAVMAGALAGGLATSIASSSTPPGSSSGFSGSSGGGSSGGGSSGGGGGGGGGGGW